MADPKTNDRSDEMEHDLHKLEDHIVEAEKKLEARKEEAEIVNDAAGGQDAGTEATSSETETTGPADSSDETRSAEDVRAEVEGKMDADAADDRIDEERSNPT